jgi:DNA-binding MarR family transcriptional regulator
MSESGRRRAGVAGKERPSVDLDGVVARLQQETPLWQAFLAVHRRVVDQLSAQMLTDHRLPLESFDVLIHLAEVPDKRLRQRDLRDRLLLSESGVSRLLVRMEKAGLLERRPAGEDRRGVEVVLTGEGAAVLATAVESHLDLVRYLFTDRLTATDRVALDHILTKLDCTAGSDES